MEHKSWSTWQLGTRAARIFSRFFNICCISRALFLETPASVSVLVCVRIAGHICNASRVSSVRGICKLFVGTMNFKLYRNFHDFQRSVPADSQPLSAVLVHSAWTEAFAAPWESLEPSPTWRRSCIQIFSDIDQCKFARACPRKPLLGLSASEEFVMFGRQFHATL